jgi:hypothetical protein
MCTAMASFLSQTLEWDTPHHLERLLETSVCESSLLKLGIPSIYIPKVTGLLPRLFHRDLRHLSKIKDSFSYLPALKKQYIDKTLLYLYSSYQPKKTASIVIFTWVIGDGFGDYFTQIEAANILQETFPEISFVLITLVHEGTTLPLTSLPYTQYFVPYKADLHKGWDAITDIDFPTDAMHALHSASLILQIPTCFPSTHSLLQQIRSSSRPKYELVGEGGWIDTPLFNPLTGARCMGLHFLEKGVFIKKIPKLNAASSITSLKNERIKSILSTHLGSYRFNLAYIRYNEGLYLYLYTLLKNLENSQSDLIICVFHLEHLIGQFEISYKSLFLQFGIKQVTLYYQNKMTKISLSSNGKCLKLVQMEQISHDDYLILLSLCSDLAGCRGDGSIFETISASKVPFFDIAPHQKKFLKDLISLAQFYHPEYPEAAAYLQLFLFAPILRAKQSENEWIEEWPDSQRYTLEELGEKMGTLLQNPKCREGLRLLCETIQTRYDVKPVLQNLTLRALCHYDHPQMEILENHALDAFLFGEDSLSNILSEIKKDISIFTKTK